MAKDQAQTILTEAFRKNHVDAALRHFSGMVQEFQKGEWEDCISKSGKFVEAVLKALFVHVGKTPPGGRSFKADAVVVVGAAGVDCVGQNCVFTRCD